MLDFLCSLPLVGGLVTYLIPFLVLLTLVVFVHELGHYLVARWRGVRSDVFSVGFGPEIFGWTDRRGTRWRFSWVPLGGYVRFAGDADPASFTAEARDQAPPGTFLAASLWSRVLVVSAGPAMNFVFAAAVFAAIAWIGGMPAPHAVVGAIYDSERMESLGLQAGDRIEAVDGRLVDSAGDALYALQDTAGAPVAIRVLRGGAQYLLEGRIVDPVRIGQVVAGSAADLAGLQPGDSVLKADGEPIHSFAALRASVIASGGNEMVLEVERDRRLLVLFARPTLRQAADPESGGPSATPMLGVSRNTFDLFQPAREPVELVDALGYGVTQTFAVVVVSLWFVGDLIAGEGDAANLGGPIAIAEFSGVAAKRGAWDFFYMLALISASIGLINLFPIPVLDGGHLVLYALEGVRGRPLGARASRFLGWLGLTLIVTLMVFVTYNDIVRF